MFVKECINKKKAVELFEKEALTGETDSREIYIKGIDNSYYYKDDMVFKTEEL